jgi:hypothetical protein
MMDRLLTRQLRERFKFAACLQMAREISESKMDATLGKQILPRSGRPHGSCVAVACSGERRIRRPGGADPSGERHS